MQAASQHGGALDIQEEPSNFGMAMVRNVSGSLQDIR